MGGAKVISVTPGAGTDGVVQSKHVTPEPLDRTLPVQPPPQTAPAKSQGRFRSSRRRSHHADAHAEPEAVGQLPTHPAHPLICGKAPKLIESQEELDDLVVRLRAAGEFAYDSEFIGEETFTPKLCLVQIATAEEIALVDPLAPGLDLIGFWKLICEPGVAKIVHAGQQDIEPVVRLTGEGPQNVFDTQIAAGFCSLTYPVALSKLALEFVGVKLAKSMTFTQWDARPLSSTQLRYAADDVRYLPAIKADLSRLLAAAGHTEKAREEFESLCEPSQYRFNPDTYVFRVRGSGSLTGGQMKVLRELVVWRDGAARVADVPARAFLKDEILVDIVRSSIKSVDRLDKIRGLPKPVEREHGQAIVDCQFRAQSAPPVPNVPDARSDDPGPRLKFRADALFATAQSICYAAGIDPMIATSRAEVGRLAYAVLTGEAIPHDVHLLTGWRKALLGDRLMELLRD